MRDSAGVGEPPRRRAGRAKAREHGGTGLCNLAHPLFAAEAVERRKRQRAAAPIGGVERQTRRLATGRLPIPNWSRSPRRSPGVTSPWLGGLVGVEKRDLVAVSERLGDERWRTFEDELADGAVARAEDVDA